MRKYACKLAEFSATTAIPTERYGAFTASRYIVANADAKEAS